MLLAGDEFGRTQLGNNNAYCQDSPLTWLNWDLAPEERELLEFVRGLIRLRTRNPVFRRRHFFQGRPIHGLDVKDIYWLTPAGTEMSDQDWNAGYARCLGMGLLGTQIDESDTQGEPVVSGSFLILLNAHNESVPFRLSGRARDQNWELVFDTSSTKMTPQILGRLVEYPLQVRSVAVLSSSQISKDS